MENSRELLDIAKGLITPQRFRKMSMIDLLECIYLRFASFTFQNVNQSLTMSSIEEKILQIISENRPDIDVSADIHFIEEGLLDSFDVLTLSAAFDKAFGISIAGADIRPENFDTIAGMAELVRRSMR